MPTFRTAQERFVVTALGSLRAYSALVKLQCITSNFCFNVGLTWIFERCRLHYAFPTNTKQPHFHIFCVTFCEQKRLSDKSHSGCFFLIEYILRQICQSLWLSVTALDLLGIHMILLLAEFHGHQRRVLSVMRCEMIMAYISLILHRTMMLPVQTLKSV